MRRLLPVLALALLTLVAGPRRGAAQTCGGDCDGDGMVTVSELITAVNIVLGGAALDACSAILPGGGTPSVSHLVAAVSNALCGCAPCPTAPPTHTPTATPLPATATPSSTAIPTATPLVTTWVEDMPRLTGSTCPKSVNDSIRDSIAGQGGTYRITERNGQALVETGGGTDVATVDGEGVLHDTFSDSDTQGSCTVFVDGAIAVPLRMTPATAVYRYVVTSSGCPRDLDCTLTIRSRWRQTNLTP